jgi:predicted type IV restriction endonuclease
MLQSEEVCDPKTINIKQYLNKNNFSVKNRHFVIKSSQTTQLYIAKVFYKQFNSAAWQTKTKVVDLLLKSGACLSEKDNQVIKPTVRLRQSNIKLFM